MGQKSFKRFRTKFTDAISSPALGEPPRYKQRADENGQSPASKELRETKLLGGLLSENFCRTIYRLSQRYQQLEAARQEVPQISRRMRPAIEQYRLAVNHLRRCAQDLEKFEKKYGSLIENQAMHKIASVRVLMEDVTYELESRSKILVSNVHQKHRKKHYEPSEWDLLFTLHNYPLEKITSKAPDQWFLTNANVALAELVKRKRLRVSDMTRFKVLSAICGSAISCATEATAIKQFFLDHPSQDVLARKK
jgi:hypothetical protein